MLDLTFKQVCELIKRDAKEDSTLIDATDKLLGLALVCSPLAVGPGLIAALPTLGTKNELIRLGKFVFEKITGKEDEDYVARRNRMEGAYGLIVFTSFFDAIDSQLPKRLRERIGSLDPHKAFLAKEAARKSRPAEALVTVYDVSDAPMAAVEYFFPHPTETLSQQAERHTNLWQQMSQGFIEFLQRLTFWDETKEKEQTQIVSAIQKAVEVVPGVFESQYFQLARKFEDFAVWANLHEHARTKLLIKELSKYVKDHSTMSQAAATNIDIGFERLHNAVLGIPENLKIEQAKELVEGLSRNYKARVNEPIIEDKEEPEPQKPKLVFPRIREAFIPQAFRVLRQSGKARRLEDESVWDDLPRRNDLGAFLLSYLTSPYSTEAPLLILGHPGSGKSLLTKVVASQLMSKQFTAVRVPLREVNADAGIVSQIEEAIRQITNISVDSWAKLSGSFKNNPPLVVLDGYDELLQASGKVFASYLKDVQYFQKNEAEQGRPVRVIVTSRVTLIDKATVPSGATIIRLLEFDEERRSRWISIWNKANVNYFRETKIEQFELPAEDEDGADKILALAEQPLLLLMLALYDSESNQLRGSKGLDRTKLYDSLLRRFVTREREKVKSFEDLKFAEKKKALDTEMQRLGVAALGMYNRRKVHILAPEVNDDLKFFNLEKLVSVTDGKPLSEADLLLGSFFFVHKSKAQHAAGAPDTHEEMQAFEFLHNTFGEFLTADFILRRAFAEVEALRAFQQNEALGDYLEKQLNDADGFKREWFASLVYTPLFTRPVVMEMMREWIIHILRDRDMSRDNFLSTLDLMILNQLERLLDKREMPSIICKETAQEGYRALFGDHPLLGHIAIYSINLILLRVLVSSKPFVFDETQIDTHEDGARPWDRLTHIWRGWFSFDHLNGITAVMQAERQGSLISIAAKPRFQVAESQTRLETYLNVGISLADNISSGLTGLVLFEPAGDNQLGIDEISERLDSEKIDLQFQVSLKRLLEIEFQISDDNVQEYCNQVRQAFSLALHAARVDELDLIALSLRRAVQRIRLRQQPFTGRDVIRQSLDPQMAADIAFRSPQAGLFLWRVAKDIGDSEWARRFARGFFEYGFRRRHPMELIERSPETWASWLELARELNASHAMDSYRQKFWPEFIERTFDPRYLLDISRDNPLAAVSWVQLAREFGGTNFLRYFDRDFLDRTFETRDLFEMTKRHPDLMIGWLLLITEGGVDRILHELDPEILRRLTDPPVIEELINRNPKAAIDWIRVVLTMDKTRLHRNNLTKVLQRFFDPKYGMDLLDLKAEAAAAWIDLAREVGMEGLHGYGRAFWDRAVHPRRLWELGERHPEVALMWLQFLADFGGDDLIQNMGGDLLQERLDPILLGRILRTHPAVFAFALRLVRLTKSSDGIEMIVASLTEGSTNNSVTEKLSSLPISAMGDIQWLIGKTGNKTLKTAFSNLQSAVN